MSDDKRIHTRVIAQDSMTIRHLTTQHLRQALGNTQSQQTSATQSQQTSTPPADKPTGK
jgi:hypothetical protein